MRAKVAILSTDLNIKRFLGEEMSKAGFSVEMALNTLLDIPKIFNIKTNNVLILDTDTMIVPALNLKKLSEDHGIFIILLGIKNAAPFLMCGVKGALSKPESTNDFAKKVFARNVIERIESFLRNYSPVRPSDIALAADVNSKIIAIAASTGGTEALNVLLNDLPANVPPILIVQHMPSVFTHQFAMRLDRTAKFAVKEAAVNDFVKQGQALIAPGDLHMKIVKRGTKLLVECFNGDKKHGVRPAADILFESMAEFLGPKVIGVILTGMGADGARGLYLLKRKGAAVIAQDKDSCVVYGMPKAAVDLGVVDYQLPLNKIAGKIIELI